MIKNNAAITNSSHVAAYFGKRHDNVLRDIDNLIALEPSIALNFEEIEIEAKVGFGTRKVRAFDMTRDGFTLLAFGFTGKKALGFKRQYIQQFNVMEEMLKAPVKEQSLLTTSNALSTFNFNNNEIRAVTIDDQPWFVAADVCRALEVYIRTDGRVHTYMAVQKLDKDEVLKLSYDEANPIGLKKITSRGRGVILITESGMNKLAMRSDKPEADYGDPSNRRPYICMNCWMASKPNG